MSLLDTPVRSSLTAQSAQIRHDLKAFERDFFAAHCHKPGKEDIKQNADIAAKYKQYNKLRDVLSGKLPAESLTTASPTQDRQRKRPRHDEAGPSVHAAQTPRKGKIAATATPRKQFGSLQPHELDPYDAPSSVSPRPPITALGPTPQRDGRVLGIFDLLEASGGSSGKKRKRTGLFDAGESLESPVKKAPAQEDSTNAALAQTPARSRVRYDGDLLEHLAGTPTTGRHQVHARTPASSAKKFMLNQFFATPSAVRYASMLQSTDTKDAPDAAESKALSPAAKTPLLDRVLGRTPTKSTTTGETQGDQTPAYLKRSYSFKQRLLSASATTSRRNSFDDSTALPAPEVQRVAPGQRKSRFNPRPLSQIAQEIKDRDAESVREQAAAAKRQREQDGGDDDEMDALREIEVNDNDNDNHDFLIGDSQIGDIVAEGEQPAFEQPAVRKWKKKGQKRTTRRVIMRPSKVPIQDARYRKGSPETEEDSQGQSDEEDQEEAGLDSDDDRVKETQQQQSRNAVDADFSDDELLAEAFADSDDELFGGAAPKAASGPSKTLATPAGTLGKPSSSSKKQKSKDGSNKPSKPSKQQRRSGRNDSDEDDDQPVRKINPNAQSHMNFRSLKIKNKNSKAKGRGRFGGGRGRR